MNHNSMAANSLQGLDVEQSPNAQDAFRPMPGLFSCAGVTGSVGVLHHVYTYNTDGWPYCMYTVEPLIKDTLNKGHLVYIKALFDVPTEVYFRILLKGWANV